MSRPLHTTLVAWAVDGQRFAYVRTADPRSADRTGKEIEVYDVASGRSQVISQSSKPFLVFGYSGI